MCYDWWISPVRARQSSNFTQVVVTERVNLLVLSSLISSLCGYMNWNRFVPLPKSVTPSRIWSNTHLYDFVLDEHDMQQLDNLDRGKEGAVTWNPVDADWRWCTSFISSVGSRCHYSTIYFEIVTKKARQRDLTHNRITASVLLC